MTTTKNELEDQVADLTQQLGASKTDRDALEMRLEGIARLAADLRLKARGSQTQIASELEDLIAK